jgi:hypothetical protein
MIGSELTFRQIDHVRPIRLAEVLIESSTTLQPPSAPLYWILKIRCPAIVNEIDKVFGILVFVAHGSHAHYTRGHRSSITFGKGVALDIAMNWASWLQGVEPIERDNYSRDAWPREWFRDHRAWKEIVRL